MAQSRHRSQANGQPGMSLGEGFPWSFKNHSFKGYSVAGQTTSLFHTNSKICFDIAQGLPFHLNAKLYCLTHVHADHGAGLNYILSQRSLFRLPEVNIMLPAQNVESIEIILREWMKIEGFQYRYKLIPVDAKTTLEFTDHLVIKTFPTTHRVTSFGYLVYQKKKKLKPEFATASREEIMAAKQKNETIEEGILTPIIAFTGDTQIEFIDAHPDVTKAEILFMECTYFDEKKSVAEARKWGHLHLEEFLENMDRFENDHISLIHLSARHSTQQAAKILNERLPDDKKSKVSIFPRPL